RWRDGQRLPSRTRIRTYVSSVKPPARLCETHTPVTTEVRGDYFGQPVRIPSCLHPEVKLTSQRSDSATVLNATPGVTLTNNGNTLLYGATNHQDWEDHVCDVDVAFVDGLWRRVETTVFAPEAPPLTYV